MGCCHRHASGIELFPRRCIIDDIETRTLDERDTAVVRRRMHAGELTAWLSTTYGTLTLYLQRIGVPTIGPPLVRYHEHGDHVDVEAGRG